MNEIKIYHFAYPSQNKILSFVDRISDLNVILCFDLEDFVKDVFDRKKEKIIHRESVLKTLESISSSNYEQKIGLRVNSINTKEFYQDIELLESVKNKFSYECIFLPKVENGYDVIKCNELLRERNIDFGEVIPIIENRNAFERLSVIINSSNTFIRKLSFGHCDFNYDLGNFPFYHQDSEQYWDWINYIIKNIGSKKITFINSPYLSLDDSAGFLKMLSRLSNITNKTYGQITLSLKQINTCSFCGNYSDMLSIKNKRNGLQENKELNAIKIIKDYESNMKKDRSFSVNTNRVLISPQEYMAAIIYLQEMDVYNEF